MPFNVLGAAALLRPCDSLAQVGHERLQAFRVRLEKRVRRVDVGFENVHSVAGVNPRAGHQGRIIAPPARRELTSSV